MKTWILTNEKGQKIAMRSESILDLAEAFDVDGEDLSDVIKAEVVGADYEKVINGLKCCVEFHEARNCENCPYDGTDNCDSKLNNDAYYLINELKAQLRDKDEEIESLKE
jgi:hypothetical protein